MRRSSNVHSASPWPFAPAPVSLSLHFSSQLPRPICVPTPRKLRVLHEYPLLRCGTVVTGVFFPLCLVKKEGGMSIYPNSIRQEHNPLPRSPPSGVRDMSRRGANVHKQTQRCVHMHRHTCTSSLECPSFSRRLDKKRHLDNKYERTETTLCGLEALFLSSRALACLL